MILTNLVRLEHTIGENIYHFMCSPNAPLQEVENALVQFLTHCNNVATAAQAAQSAAAAQQAAVAPVEPVENVSADIIPINSTP